MVYKVMVYVVMAYAVMAYVVIADTVMPNRRTRVQRAPCGARRSATTI